MSRAGVILCKHTLPVADSSDDDTNGVTLPETGGMYPELVTRPDLQAFLPPIGGLTVYIFGNPAHLSDPSKELTLRVHDECNGSDVFGSDICTCRPYLIYGIEESIKCAQRGGVGLVVYFRKEGRALGEVTKCESSCSLSLSLSLSPCHHR